MSETRDLLFVAYARKDEDFALRLAHQLRDAAVNVWIDQLNVVPGDAWDDVVERALKDANTVLVVLSQAAVDSRHVMNEVNFALDEGKRVVPVRCQSCPIPLGLRRLQYIDFTTGAYDVAFDRLVKALRRYQSGNPAETGVERSFSSTVSDNPLARPVQRFRSLLKTAEQMDYDVLQDEARHHAFGFDGQTALAHAFGNGHPLLQEWMSVSWIPTENEDTEQSNREALEAGKTRAIRILQAAIRAVEGS